MDKLAEHHDIVHFATLLMTETDAAKRALLQRLLTDEKMVGRRTAGQNRPAFSYLMLARKFSACCSARVTVR